MDDKLERFGLGLVLVSMGAMMLFMAVWLASHMLHSWGVITLRPDPAHVTEATIDANVTLPTPPTAR